LRSAPARPAALASSRLRPASPSSRRDRARLARRGALDHKRCLRVAAYADEIAATLARAGDALARIETQPVSRDKATEIQAIRELGRISGYIETLVGVLDHHLDGRKLAGVKRRLEQLRPGELRKSVISGRKPIHIDRLASAEGYFRALADGLRT
jgi:hypothetical protein